MVSQAQISVQEVDENCLKRMETFEPRQTLLLQQWFLNKIDHPYFNKQEITKIAAETGLQVRQIQGWFTNNRKRKY